MQHSKVFVVALLALGLTNACAPNTPDTSVTTAGEESTLADCSEASILAGVSAAAMPFFERAYQWIDAGVAYCECVSGAGGSYRTDCSGFVSHAWGLPAPGNTTYSFAGGPWNNGTSTLISMAELQPGDALNFPGDPSAGTGHIVMFGGWLNSAHTEFCSLEESHTGTNARVIVRSVDPAFLPIRRAGYSPGPAPESTPVGPSLPTPGTPPATPDPNLLVGIVSSLSGHGYVLAAADGGAFAMGDGSFHGSMGGTHLAAPVVGIAATPSGNGYWMVGSDGGVFSFGDAGFHGSMGGTHLIAPVIGIAATPSGNGYWLVATDGGVFSFGDAGFHGSMGGQHLNAPVVGMAATPSGNGYWLVGSDGGVFSFGDAGFHGSMGGMHLDAPVTAMAATPSGDGYWLVATDGGVFSFGDAGFHGSMGGMHLDAPVSGMARTPSGNGYWLIAYDGGVFTFGDAVFEGGRAH